MYSISPICVITPATAVPSHPLHFKCSQYTQDKVWGVPGYLPVSLHLTAVIDCSILLVALRLFFLISPFFHPIPCMCDLSTSVLIKQGPLIDACCDKNVLAVRIELLHSDMKKWINKAIPAYSVLAQYTLFKAVPAPILMGAGLLPMSWYAWQTMHRTYTSSHRTLP